MSDEKVAMLQQAWWKPDPAAVMWLSANLELATPSPGAVLLASRAAAPSWFYISVAEAITVFTPCGAVEVATLGITPIIRQEGVAATTIASASPVWIGHSSVLQRVLEVAPVLALAAIRDPDCPPVEARVEVLV